MEEREINLVDLLVEILLRWRGILILMAVGGILMGAFSYARSSRSVEEQVPDPNAPEIGSEEYDEYLKELQAEEKYDEYLSGQLTEEEYGEYLSLQLKETELVKVHSVISNEDLYDEMKENMDQSVLMQIDSLNVPRTDLVYVVMAEKEKQDQNISMVYKTLVGSIGCFEWLAEKNSMSSTAVSELISVGSNHSFAELEGIHAIKITVIHQDREACEALAQSVMDYIEQQHDKLREMVGEHEIVLLDRAFSVMRDESLMNVQISKRNNLVSLINSADSIKTEFTPLQEQYYDFLRGDENEADDAGQKAEEKVEALNAAPSVSIKYVVLGMILAAFLYVFILFIQYIFSGKLRKTDDLGEIYGVSQLGLIPDGDKKKKLFGQVDEKIQLLRERNKRRFTVEEAVELAATAVKIAAEKNPSQPVCLLGCDLKAGAMKVCERIKEKLEQSNISVKILDNILYDAEALEQLSDVGGAVLVERAGSTLYAEIGRELELLSRQEVRVLGGIIC